MTLKLIVCRSCSTAGCINIAVHRPLLLLSACNYLRFKNLKDQHFLSEGKIAMNDNDTSVRESKRSEK